MFFSKKTVIERYEEEFKTEHMRNKHIFYDLNIRAGDPEELRSFSMELLEDLGFTTILNEMTKFDDPEFEGIFRGGRLKPTKSIIKSLKELDKGSKFPIIWKIFLAIGIVSLLLYVLPWSLVQESTILSEWKSYSLWIGGIFILAAIIVYYIKEKIGLAVWIKIAGIYDVEDEKCDVHLMISGDSEKKDKEAFKKLENDLAELYDVISRKYIKRKEKEPKITIGREPEIQALNSLREINKEIDNLQKRFTEGKVSEETYKQLKEELERKKDRYETILDIVTAGK
ncbi:MAG: hypothetical protein OH319_02490 [Candidatus Parvarchaeota archaeon]|nr:hypothetical protein [Candidatus Jingweiarchaeum tengchongense]MCW1298236.1 hypothetical protein [Candidatus Jingweiarchaeum tengchongense]MCW1300034.1 hypothetical protein [Candidatus Jingweiarchaeum tengchongense]MCW1304827.1 hypothetical protein [Candidatus Jingweiarchaeum tengchongense]MCW1305417.1 hypothetical protein [Candidatus Jingweiarchaeum tengchongense]